MARKLFLFLGGAIAPALLAVFAWAAPPDPTNVVFSNIQATSLAVDWQGTTGTTIQFTIEMSSSAFVTPLSSDTFVLTSTFTSLDINTLYFARVIAIDTIDLSSSAWTASISTYTHANPPLALVTTLINSVGVDLSWNSNGNPTGTLFSIERTTDSIVWTVLGTQSITTYTDNSVTPGLTYDYRVQALNTWGIGTTYSNTVTAVIPGSTSLPLYVTGLEVTRTQTGPSLYQIDMQWPLVTLRTDNTVLSNFEAYQIFMSTSLLTPRSQWVNVSSPTTNSWTTTTDGTVHYYAMKTKDNGGQTSAWSRIVDDGADLNHIFMADDNISRLQIPQSAADSLLRGQNATGSDLEITLTQVTAEETGRVAKSIEIKIINYDTGSEVTNFTFNSPVIRGTLGYTVQSGNVVAGAPSVSRAQIPLISAAEAADKLALYWFNGNEWVKTSALIDPTDRTVTFTGTRIGRYQIRAASHASGMVLTRVYPRIFSPNNDGWNDKVIFEFDNPQLLPLSGKVYDLSNAFVAELAAGPTPDSTLAWDGKDSGGVTVPGGLYIYQIEQGGDEASGAIVVAR